MHPDVAKCLPKGGPVRAPKRICSGTLRKGNTLTSANSAQFTLGEVCINGTEVKKNPLDKASRASSPGFCNATDRFRECSKYVCCCFGP